MVMEKKGYVTQWHVAWLTDGFLATLAALLSIYVYLSNYLKDCNGIWYCHEEY